MTEKERLEQRRSQFVKNCKWCGTEFKPKRKTKEYCSDKCRAHYNINKGQGATASSTDESSPISNNSKQETTEQSHLEGLRGVVDDHSTSLNYRTAQKNKAIPQLEKIDNQLKVMYRQFSEASQELENLRPMQGGTVIGSSVGLFATNRDSGFWSYVLNGVIGGVAGYAGQQILNSQVEKRQKELVAFINQLRENIKRLTRRKKSLEEAKSKTLGSLNLANLFPTKKNHAPVKQVPVQNGSKKLMSSSELIRMSFQSLDFKGDWRSLVGKPAPTFHMVIHGRPGQGKSTFSLLFADYLATNFGNVLYASSEEGHNKTMKDKCILNKMDNPNLIIGDFRNTYEILEEVQPNQFHFIVIDSLDDLGMGIDDLKEFREVYSNSALITVSQSTKNGQMRGSQQIIHDCDVEIKVDGGVATANKNRFGKLGFEFEVFPEEDHPKKL